jgi:hypothetical protein
MDVVSVKVVRPYVLDVTFENGESRRVDVSTLLWGPMFEPLKDPEYFARVEVNKDIGTVAWPNGADIAPEYLYESRAVSQAF